MGTSAMDARSAKCSATPLSMGGTASFFVSRMTGRRSALMACANKQTNQTNQTKPNQTKPSREARVRNEQRSGR